MRDDCPAGQKTKYSRGKSGGNPPPPAIPIGGFRRCRTFGEIGLSRDARQFNRCPRKAVVDCGSRQRVERFPCPIELVQLLPILLIGRESTFDAAAILRRK